jgi:hypothetical protein
LLIVAMAPAPIGAISFADAMLNKLTAGTGDDTTVGPYPEEGFRTGGRIDLEQYLLQVINAFGSSADVYVPKLNEFAPQFFFNDTVPNRARDNFTRDFARLKDLAGV